jgi:hypothetical protein
MFDASPPAQKLAVAVDISQLVPSQLLKIRLKISNPARQRQADTAGTQDSPPNIAPIQLR